MTVLGFPRQAKGPHPDLIISRDRPCPECGHSTAMLRRYPQNSAISWHCTLCQGLVRSRGRLFIPHRELRACGIAPDRLPEVRR